MEVSDGRFLSIDRCAKRVPGRLSLVPLKEVSPTLLRPHEEEVIFLVLQLEFLLDARHKALLVI